MDRMEVPLTVPIVVSGQTVCEFEAVVDVEVTYWGCKAQTYGPPERCYPAECPEWYERAFYVDVGSWDTKTKRWKKILLDAPKRLVPYINEYIETDDGRDHVVTYIMEHRDTRERAE